MPAVYIFSKRTMLGGDDLQIPAVLTILARVAQLSLLLLPQWYYLIREARIQEDSTTYHYLVDFLLIDPDQDCKGSHFVPLLVCVYLSMSILFCSASIILEYQIFWWSCQGTPVNRQPRTEMIEALLELKLLWFSTALGVAFITYCLSLVFWSDFCQDEESIHWMGSTSWWSLSIIFALAQLAEILLATAFWSRLVHVDRMRNELVEMQEQPHHHEYTEELWAERCHWMCQCLSMSTCFIFGGQELSESTPYYQQLSKALADYLETRGALDVVPTDLVTGLLVLQRVQRQRILQARAQIVRSNQNKSQDAARFGESRRSLEIEDCKDDKKDHHPNITTRDIHISNPSTVLRYRTSSSGELKESEKVGLKRRASSLSVNPSPALNTIQPADLPETTRLVSEITSPSTQPVFRRINQLSHEALPQYESQTREILNPFDPTDSLRLLEGARMAKFALSIYTWMLYVFAHPVTGIPRLLCRSCGLCQCGGRCLRINSDDSQDSNVSRSSLLNDASLRQTIVGDNICGWHKEALLQVAGISGADLVFAQFLNRVSLVPYCILLDHDTQTVVVSIRGSLSLDDLVTDVNLDPECVFDLAEEHGFDADQDQFCHAGVVASARNVYIDLQRHGLLDELLNIEYTDYQLRLVGHSLGAGICTLLGYMLKNKFPSLRVFNFSPPGGTMTWKLATSCQDWATSYILDSDIVPRLSVPTLERLRDEVLTMVGQLKVPKYRVLTSFWTGQSRKTCCAGATVDNASRDLTDLNELVDAWLGDGIDSSENASFAESPQETSYDQQLREFQSIQEELKEARGSIRDVRLYPPGKMIHLLKTGEEGGCGHVTKKIATCCTTNSGFEYTPVYIANDDLDEILVSPTMATDHFIDRIADELADLAKDYDKRNVAFSERMLDDRDIV